MAMSDDPFLERLSGFTPDAAGLDRDALLFAAGRASARPSRRWQALAGTLAACQLLTLGLLLWPRPAPPTDEGLPIFREPVAVQEADRPPSTPAPGALALRDRLFAAEAKSPPPLPADALLPAEPPLRAFGAPPPALLNGVLFSRGVDP